MTPVTISKTGTGRSAVIASDSFQNPFNVGLVIVVTGTATFNIEISMDDPSMAVPTVYAVPSGFSALTASANGSITIPHHALSINVTSGTGTVTAYIVQAGIR
jgi:multidrug transporter EmrE-like cation transporter